MAKMSPEELNKVNEAIEILRKHEAHIVHTSRRVPISINGNRGRVEHDYHIIYDENEYGELSVDVGEDAECEAQMHSRIKFKENYEDYQDREDW